MITLRLFGGASLERDGEALSGPANQRHRLALLALLCVSHPRPLSRDKLLGYLWPERDSAHARQLLNQALHVLRKALGDDAILSVGDELRLGSPPLDCDVLAFGDALAAGDLAGATALYRGPLLDGFFLGDSPEFERWLDQERERLRGEWRGALAALAELELESGAVERAAGCWRRLLGDDPYDARATIGLMETLATLGDRAGALRQARLYELLLEEDLGARPDPAVRALADRIRAGEGAAAASVAASSPAVRPEAAGGAAAAEPPERGGMEAAAAAGVAASDAAAPGAAPFADQRRSWKRGGGWAVALLALATMAWASTHAFSAAHAPITRIAVLPLANLTGDPGQDYFVAGMHDALISELAKVGALTVYSRQSVLRYQGSERPLPEIARELGVDALVEGSVFESGDSVRISVQLVRAQPERHLLSRTFVGPLSHALALQGRVARAVAEATRTRLTPAVRAEFATDRAVEPGAQKAYLAGLYHLQRATSGRAVSDAEMGTQMRLAAAKLEEAVALDSTWAAAYAKLARADNWLASSGFGDPDEYYAKAKAAAQRAIQLDDAESEAYALLGFELYRHEYDWTGAVRAFQRANELDPNSHHWLYALFLAAAGWHDQAIAEFHRAEERDPGSDILKAELAGEYRCAGRYEEALAQASELHDRVASPENPAAIGNTLWLLTFEANVYSLAGAHEKAIDAAQGLLARTDTPTAGPVLALALAMGGRREEARTVVARLGPDWARRVDGWQPGVFAALGDTARVLAITARLVGARSQNVVNLRCWPLYRMMHDNPRFQALLKPIGFPRISGGGSP